MIIFFYGPNDYLLKRKLKELKEKYQTASKGSFDLVTLEGVELNAEKFICQIQTVALFATTRLIIINQIFDCPKEVQAKIKEYLSEISKTSVVVFVHTGEPDKRLGLFKALNKPKSSQYFKAIDQANAVSFIFDEAKKRGANIDQQAAQYLVQIIGSDPWQISNEIEKLSTYKNGEKITQKDIDELVCANVFANVFNLIDALVAQNKKKSLRELEKIIAICEPPLKVLGAINFQFRLIALAKDELERGEGAARLASKLKVNPFPLSKALPYAKNFTWQNLDMYYVLMSELDENIKTGKIIPEEALKEFVLRV